MGTIVSGYNIKLKVAGKTILGVTQDDLSITPTTKESITKDDNGVKKSAVTGHEITFKVAGLIEVKGSSDTNALDAGDLLEMALAKGDDAIYAFVYNRGDVSYQGNCVMTSYSESTPADSDSDATFSADFKVSGEMTEVD